MTTQMGRKCKERFYSFSSGNRECQSEPEQDTNLRDLSIPYNVIRIRINLSMSSLPGWSTD